MKKLSEEKRAEIVRVLQDRGATLPCPRCDHKEFFVSDGYFFQDFQAEFSDRLFGGMTDSSVLTIAIICKNCGFMSHHAVGAIGLMPEELKK